jgi:hypothetical protein
VKVALQRFGKSEGVRAQRSRIIEWMPVASEGVCPMLAKIMIVFVTATAVASEN